MTRQGVGACGWRVLALATSMALGAGPGEARPRQDAVEALVASLESAVGAGDRQAVAALTTLAPDDPSLTVFLSRWVSPETTRVTLHERDRVPLSGQDGLRVVVEALVERGDVARAVAWRLDVTPGDAPRIAAIATLSVVEGLFRLSLDPTVQYRARNLVVSAEDLQLTLDDGHVFVAGVPGGPTAAVLLGNGEMVFTPGPETERRQIALLTGGPALRQRFSAAMVRMNPADAAARLPPGQLVQVPVDPRRLARARQVFAEEIGKAFSIDLADMSRDTWSLVPGSGNLLAEVRTRRYGTLTYAHDRSDEEDISLFDRRRRRNLSIYASTDRLARRGPFYSEDSSAEFDVLDYNVDTTFQPDRLWLDGRTRLRVRSRVGGLSTLTVRLAESLVVRSVVSDRHGRVLHVRVRNQNSLVVNLPEAMALDDEQTLTFTYGGRHEPQGMDQENLALDAQAQVVESAFVQPEPHYLYSNRSYWYAQPTRSDYATATIRFTVPPQYSAVCSGEPVQGSPVMLKPERDQGPRKLHVFAATTPLRYLSCVTSRFAPPEPLEATVGGARFPMEVSATPRQRSRGRELLAKAAEMMAFYGELVGGAPYPRLSLAVLESQIPGGHAPGYVAILNQPLPTSPFVWRDDPASFADFPDFFIAHELAHQWWGQAVGWQNYHEQWLSEGISQYFAALYAERSRGPGVFEGILRQLARWTLSTSDQGPVYLGYRLGHLKGEARVFRALVYNKGAAVLHMLRRLVGDEAFFRSLGRFYTEFKYRKAGTEDLRRAFEAESGQDFTRFFANWIYGQDLPTLRVDWKAHDEGRQVRIALRQTAGVFHFPVTVSLVYANGETVEETVAIADEVTTLERPLAARLRRVEVNRDRVTPVEVRR